MIRGKSNRWRIRGGVVANRASLEGASSHTFDNRLDSILKLLLGACNDTAREIRERFYLVNIHANAINVGIAGRFEDALTGQSCNLEQHVRALADELLGNCFTGRGIIEPLCRVWVRLLVERLDIGVNRLRASYIACIVGHNCRDVRAAHGANGARLGDAGSNDSSQITSLLFCKHNSLVVREQGCGITRARKGRITNSALVYTDALVNANEGHVRVLQGGGGRIRADQETDGDNHIEALVYEGLDVLPVV